ncbi:MAG: PaaI family thioesterase [Actinomycetota bacterium]|nr:PaaI family thioesterase [Actinomycetota bacterium]
MTQELEPLPGFASLLGLELVESSGDGVLMRWKVRPELHQPHGILHGGVHCAVVETAASIAAALWFGERGTVVGVANSTDFYRGVRDGELTSRAVPVHRGRSQQVWTVETTDEQGRLIARGQVRLQNLAAAPREERR